MGSTRTAWHVMLASLLRQRRPRHFQVQSEVPLATEPPRADYLLLRNDAPGEAGEPAGTLRRLWPLLPRETIVEFKSVRRTYRSRDLDRLWGYLSLHYADAAGRLGPRSDLAGVVLLPSRNRPLDVDAAALGLTWRDLAGGYWQLRGGAFALYVVEIDVVADAEDDDLLHLFGHRGARTAEARRWLAQQVGAKESAMAMHELEGFDEVMAKLLATLPVETVLAALPSEQVLAAYTPEQRIAGLTPEERLLLAPDEVLRLLPEDYVRSLPPDVQAKIRARRGSPPEDA
ncbi:hypothetical protein [Sorangium sp. So ce1153]|uniref:hypothetical protein n=1 Tax=Sorangium sp. So ce1153 TaxID=3133333 RepID=UPI003F62101D